ncbi:hypothetical protein V8C42DRAFT_96733 [Trichoderma barbatum]
MASKSSVQDSPSKEGINELLQTVLIVRWIVYLVLQQISKTPHHLLMSPTEKAYHLLALFLNMKTKTLLSREDSKTDEVSKAEQTLKDAMRQYENAMDSKHKLGINPDNEHSVPQLVSLITESMKNMDDRKGLWGRIQHACRKLTENKETIDGWLGLFPTDSQ